MCVKLLKSECTEQALHNANCDSHDQPAHPVANKNSPFSLASLPLEAESWILTFSASLEARSAFKTQSGGDWWGA